MELMVELSVVEFELSSVVNVDSSLAQGIWVRAIAFFESDKVGVFLVG